MIGNVDIYGRIFLTHDFSHARHGRSDLARNAFELRKIPQGHLRHAVVQRWLEAGLMKSWDRRRYTLRRLKGRGGLWLSTKLAYNQKGDISIESTP